ncbi:unnamed protein product [Chrysodeixis includens]|uniref:Uncharacterized protein n=1 Tax=Chrysodeixis includens TaxID=689277 RepID=A0A9P0BYU1_CHRIL|nr:unnamed protein product [Chrysodeixis includens]
MCLKNYFSDPEKRNLLLEHKEDKRRGQYSGSKTKIDRRSVESHSSERRKRGHLYKSSSTEQTGTEFKPGRQQSVHNQTEKRDSYWFWQKENPKKTTEETCSCVSCALKKIVNSEYACIGWLLLLFVLSIIVAFLVVFKNVPCLSGPEREQSKKCPDSERLKRKIEMLNDRRTNDVLGLDEFRKRGEYADDSTGNFGLTGSSGIDFGPSFHDLSSALEELADSKVGGDTWASALEDNPGENQSSEKLREFYKKLIQTDAKIKSLKKINQELLESEDPVNKVSEISKRSLHVNSYPRKYQFRRRRSALNKNNKFNNLPKKHANHTKIQHHLFKRHANETKSDNNIVKRKANSTRVDRFDQDEPTGFVIERKKILVKYKPEPGKKKKVPKCSHYPKDSHTHENQLKHPFYKNTQRLDELLDIFLNKNLPDIVSDPFGLDALFSKEKPNKCKHPAPHKNMNIIVKELLIDQIPKPKTKAKKVKEEPNVQPIILKVLTPEQLSTQLEKDYGHQDAKVVDNVQTNTVTASPHDFDILLSVSTIMNPEMKKTGIPNVLGRLPNIRKLMQIEGDDDETLGYEDFKEVLKDDVENLDDTEKRTDRRKRTEVPEPNEQPQEKFPKYNPPGVHNPNWKGPMPLYPDELSSMLRHTSTTPKNCSSTTPKEDSTTIAKDPQSDYANVKVRDLSDVEYVEDYLNSKYHKLAEMAQAYSDYGVLSDKKETMHEKASDSTATKHKVNVSPSPTKRSILSRLRKDRPQHIVTGTTANFRRPKAISTTEIEQMTEQTWTGPNSFFFTPTKNSEGIRFEYVPDESTRRREDTLEVLKILQKHIKIGHTTTPMTVPKPVNPKTALMANKTANHQKVKQLNNSINENATRNAQSLNTAEGEVSLIDFLNMMSNWFKTFEIGKDYNLDEKLSQDVPDLLFKNEKSESNSTESNNTSTEAMPSADTEMVDRIRHRSRKLLSIENLNVTEEKRTDNVTVTREKRAETAVANDGNASESSVLPAAVTKKVASTTINVNSKEKRQTTKKERKVKAIFKRNVDDSNLIFWNDIYDDEYGIKDDKFETIRDKHSVKQNDFIKKSGRWVHEKFRKFAENLKMNPHMQVAEIKERYPRSVSNLGIKSYPKYLYDRISERITKKRAAEDDVVDNEQKSVFTNMAANMKNVCKKAARAVQMTRNIQVREDSKQGSIAATLMQQLVRLLTDLVDYQVQQKTCTKLPSDLQNFLEWLTLPKDEAQDAQKAEVLTYKTPNQNDLDDLAEEVVQQTNDRQNDQPADYDTIAFNEKQPVSVDLRLHYLDVMHSVQDLLNHYEGMSDEDKSKMTGVKNYLEGQKRYLTSQLSYFDMHNLFAKNQRQLRYKRDLAMKPHLTKRRRKRKYVKNFGKKHTRTTASFDDAAPITDNKRKVLQDDKTIDKLTNGAFEEKVSKNVRRNLKDVYYKAVAEAKKYTKSVHKKEDNTASFPV